MTLLKKILVRLKLPTPKFFVRLFNTILRILVGVVALAMTGLLFSEYLPTFMVEGLKSLVAAGIGAGIASYILSNIPVQWNKVSDEKIEELKMPSLANKPIKNVEKELSE